MKGSTLFYFVIVVVIVLLILIGVAFWQNKQTMPQIKTLPPAPQTHYNSPSPIASTSDNQPTKDTVSTWQIYGNQEFGIEVKYPAFLNLEENKVSKNDKFFWSTVVEFGVTPDPGEGAYGTGIVIGVQQNDEPLSPDQWIKNEMADPEIYSNNDGTKNVYFQKTVINGIDAVRTVDKKEGKSISYTLFPKIKGNSFTYDLTLYLGGRSSVMPDPFQVFEGMVKTVRFIN